MTGSLEKRGQTISQKKSINMNCKQLKTIKAGHYQHQYLIYCRKSTDDNENQKNSLDHQEAECVRFAEQSGLQIAPVSLDGFCANGIVRESHSGFKEDESLTFTKSGEIKYRIVRPKFNQLVQLLNEGCFAGIVCVSWDRLSRNKTDNAIITKLIRQGRDIQFVTATYDSTSAGALHMDIDGMFAQHHSRVTKEKVTNAMHKLRDEGIVVYMAPLGYLNTGKKYKDVRSQEHKPFDPARAPIIKDIFEKYATGSWSMSDLAIWANKQGLTNFARRRPRTKAEMLSEEEVMIEAVEKPITTNNIHYMLRNPFYTGLMQNSQGQWIESLSHKALINSKLFAKVQKIKEGKQVSYRYKQPLGHALRGFVRCCQCGRVYTPYAKKGIQYFGARCAPQCGNSKKSCNLSYIETELGTRLPELFLHPEYLKELDENVDTSLASLAAKLDREREQAERRHRKLNEDLNYLQSNRLELLKSGVYRPDSYLAEEKSLLSEIANLQKHVPISAVALHEALSEAAKLSELLNRLVLYYAEAKSPEKETIMRTLFSELTMDEKSFGYSLKNEFTALKREGVGFGASNHWLSELLTNRDKIKQGLVCLERLRF